MKKIIIDGILHFIIVHKNETLTFLKAKNNTI
jgi:hypothetical protein